MHWRVRLEDIAWDDGKGEYDVSRLPTELVIVVVGDDLIEAEERALDEATDYYGALIVGATAIAKRCSVD